MSAAALPEAESDAADPARGVRLGTLVIALLVALLPPAGYFAVAYGARAAAAQTEADISAGQVGQLIAGAQDTWRYQEHRLRELLHRAGVLEEDRSRILDLEGLEIAAAGEPQGRFVLRRSAGLYDAGTLVGRVERVHSLRGLLAQTAAVALAGALLGVTVLLLLRMLLHRTQVLNSALFEEKERAQITLQSIGDAVITTGLDGRIAYLNPASESLTGWPLAEAAGRPLDDVLRLIDEATLLPVVNPLTRAVAENSIKTFDAHVALLRRDGTSVSIEDSAAPIRSRDGRVIGGVIVFRDVTAARSMAQHVSWQASHDALTGLVNRREFETRVDAALAETRNSGTQHVVCYMDLDQFKVVNDTSGHPAGDELLKQVSALLQSKVRESDTLARLGGDEFGLLLDGCGLERGKLIAADLLAAVREFRFQWEDRVFSIGLSIGLAAVDQSLGTRTEVLSAADSALFAAKETGRNRVYVYQNADTELANRRREMGWVERLTRALDRDGFRLYYQRILQLAAGPDHGTHIEVLLRLREEDGKLVLPGAFLPAAERYNLMPRIERWVIGTLFARYRVLATQFGGGPLTCSVNLSGTSLNSEELLDYIREQAAAHALPRGAICFEITETAAMNSLRRTAAFMKEIRALGFLFALDDFGSASSSFGYLKNLPVDFLKIDGGFVQNLIDDPLNRAMTETINRIGHLIGVRTVAEFAENEDIISALRAMGVDYAQGYGVGEPVPLPDDG